jgi:hypothetical protein
MFWNPWTIGAAIGAGTSLLRGSDPFKGAAIGGIMGGVGSQFANADAVSGVGSSTGGVSGVGTVPTGSSIGAGSTSPLSAGGILNGAGTNALAGGNVAQGMAMNGSALAGSSAIPSSAIIPGSIESSGMVAGASGNLVNPEYFVGAGTPFQTFTGGEGVLSNAFQNFSSNLPDYVTPDNVVGAANILSQSQPQQMPMPTSSASVSRGSPSQGNIDYGMAQPIRRRGIL